MRKTSKSLLLFAAPAIILFNQTARADMNYYAVEVNRTATLSIDHRQSFAGGLSAIKGTISLSHTDTPDLNGYLSYQNPWCRAFLGERELEPGEVSLSAGSFKGLVLRGLGQYSPSLYLGNSSADGWGRLLALGYRVADRNGGRLFLTLTSQPEAGLEGVVWAKSQPASKAGSVSGGLSYGSKGLGGSLDLEWEHDTGSLDIGALLRNGNLETWQKGDMAFGPGRSWYLSAGNRNVRRAGSDGRSQGGSLSRNIGMTCLTLSARRDMDGGDAPIDLTEASLAVSRPLQGGIMIQKITGGVDRILSPRPYYKGEMAAVSSDNRGGGMSVYGSVAWNGSGFDYSASGARDWQLGNIKYGKLTVAAGTNVTDGEKSDTAGLSFGQSIGSGHLSAELGVDHRGGLFSPRASLRYEWGLPAKLPPMAEGTDGETRVKRLIEVKGFVYRDVNYNGIYDSGDKPLPNLIVILDGIYRSKTDINGMYRFGKTEEGRHSLQLDITSVPLDLSFTASKYDFMLTDGFADHSFGLTTGAAVRGRLVRGDNGAGIRDALIRLDPGEVYAMTDSDGFYLFENVKPGDYSVELIQSDYAPEGSTIPKPQPVRVAQEPVYRMDDMTIGGAVDQGQDIEWNGSEF